MAVGAAAIAVAGTAVSIISSRKRAKAEEEAARAQAHAKREAAFEILRRAEENAEMLRFESEGFKEQQVASLIKSSLSGSALNTLAVMEDTNSKINRQIDIERRESEFSAEQLRAGADIGDKLAVNIKKTGRLESAGLFLSGAGRVASASQGGR